MKLKGKVRTALALSVFFGILACQSPVRQAYASGNRYWNDLARYLAGMPATPESVFAPLENDPGYRQHAASIDMFWERVEEETLDTLVPWRDRNVPKVKADIAFYPLSGADFVNLYSLYPDSRHYLMVALEETGDLPDPERMTASGRASLLSMINRTLYHYGRFNYFQSRIMSDEMNRGGRTGNTPVLLVLMARLGLRVAEVGAVGVDSEGWLYLLDGRGLANGEVPVHRGVQYIFYAPGDIRPRVLVYLNMRLDEKSFDPATAAGRFFRRLGTMKIVMKSAVYLLHGTAFSGVKDFLMEKSAMIIQDDSGVPFADLAGGAWDVSLFGSYLPRYPITGCTVRKQRDLSEAFGKGAGRLPFNFGYGSLLGKDRSNLIMAVRKRR